MKIINIGVYPPPFGGVSIHLKRLKEYLDNGDIDNIIIDLSKYNSRAKANNGIKVMSWKEAILSLFFHKKAILHFHNFSWKSALIYYILGFKHFTILSFHNERFLGEIKKSHRVMQILTTKFINAMNYIIVDSQKCRAIAEQIIEDKSKIFIVPEFIPPSKVPVLSEQNSIMQIREKHKFLLSSNAFQISFHNGIDLYGIDMLIELTARLNKENIDTAFCFLLPKIGNDSYFLKLKEEVIKLNISDRFLFITNPLKEASSLWKESDLCIRATNTDGNSLSVLESLSVGTPVIASDCVPRPEGVVLFKTRDFNDLYEKTKMVLLNVNEFKNKVKSTNIENNAYKMISLYKSILKEVNNK